MRRHNSMNSAHFDLVGKEHLKAVQRQGSFFFTYHEPSHTLLLNPLLLFLLFPLGVGVPSQQRLVHFADSARDVAVVVFEVLGVLYDGIQIFLQTAKR